MKDLLFEIGTEELPAGFLAPASDQLESLFTQKAKKLKISFSSIQQFCTPRRLALLVKDLNETQEDSTETLLGPSKHAAYDKDGNPTKAAEGFARSKGVSVDDLEIVNTQKGEYLQLVRHVKGDSTEAVLPALLKDIVLELSFPKSMKWGSNSHTFARPIQWILALHGTNQVTFEHEGIVSGTKTRGHRFMAPDSIDVSSAGSYEEILESVYVIADIEKRKEMVLSEIRSAVSQSDFGETAHVSVHQGLLDTVTNLVEFPYGVCGRFDQKFLQVPSQVLVTSMREHQKYFPVVNEDDGLLPGFVAVNNTKVNNLDLTREGHQRVIRARLEDAFFFYESDKKHKLNDRVDSLTGIIFQSDLGTMKEKAERIIKLARIIAESVDPAVTEDSCRAALLCKADLITDMVGEFPSLQGAMGAAYAENDKENEAVVLGIQEHYMPVRSGAPLPTTAAGAIVGLADRIDTIAGCFGINQVPTGTTDPYGLRRLSLALLHIIEDRGYILSLPELFNKALALYGSKVDGSSRTVDQILEFIRRRFDNDCIGRKMDSRAVEAVTSVQFKEVIDSLERIVALSEMKKDASFDVLAGSFKRIRNIVKDNQNSTIDESLFEERAERDLFEMYQRLVHEGEKQLVDRDYQAFLSAMLQLKEPVDRFFDDVMVMAEDDDMRRNRLNLLTAIGNLILGVGDISKMHVGS
jgi:glycyl-tRNA synthetase beta chain